MFMSQDLNFKVKTIHPTEGKFGSLVSGPIGDPEAQVWDGVVGDLKTGLADVSFTDISESYERKQVINILHGLKEARFSFIIHGSLGDKQEIVLDFGQTFHPFAWMAILGTLGIFIMLYKLTSKATIKHACTGFVYIAFQQDPKFSFDSASRRMVLITTCLFSCLIFTVFNANLTSIMTVSVESSKLESYQNILDHGFSVVTLKSTFEETILVSAENNTNSAFHKIRRQQLSSGFEFPATLEECQQLLMTSRTAFFAQQYAFKFPGSTDVAVKNPIRAFASIGLPLGSEFEELFSHVLMRYIEHGIINQLSLFIKDELPKEPKHESVEGTPTTFTNISQVFIMFFYGVGLAVIVVLLEYGAFEVTEGIL